MTVAELIEKLQKLEQPDMRVYIQASDDEKFIADMLGADFADLNDSNPEDVKILVLKGDF